jgi:hypothetical protein
MQDKDKRCVIVVKMLFLENKEHHNYLVLFLEFIVQILMVKSAEPLAKSISLG